MSSLAALRPTNEAEERKRFLAALRTGSSYEPQLKYASALKAAKVRASCDQYFSKRFADQAVQILDGVVRDYGDQTKYEAACWGDVLEASDIEAACSEYAQSNKIQGLVHFEWNPSTLVTSCVGSKVNLVPTPGYYRSLRLASLLDHEVGTHFLRLHNHKLTFPNSKAGNPAWKHDQGWLLATEEGLATINTNQSYTDKRLWVPALHYHACILASNLPFSKLWHRLAPYLGHDEDRLWITCLRVKRGLEDTGLPGGYYKDQSNFDGALRLLERRSEINFQLLHCVRVSIEDFPRALSHAQRALSTGNAILPAFVSNETRLSSYRVALDEIAAANGVCGPNAVAVTAPDPERERNEAAALPEVEL